MRQRVISLFAALCLALALQLPALAAEEYIDMPQEGAWSYEPLAAAVENGLLQGSDGLLQPSGSLTRAQLAAILVRAFGATEEAALSFSDVTDSNWFAADVAKAVAMGVFGGSGGQMRPNDSLTRQETFVVLARALCLEDGTAEDLSAFTDADQVSAWAVPEVTAMVSAGYVKGSGGALNPLGNITRAEFAQVMYSVVQSYITQAGTYETVAEGTVVVRASGVTLRGVTVSGDLIVGDSVGSGGVTLDGVTVTGRVLIRGGDESAVQMVNGSTAAGVVVRETAADSEPTDEPADDAADEVIGDSAVINPDAQPVTVTTAEAFIQALSDPDCSAITVSGEIEITGGSYTIGKPVTTGGLDNSLYFLNAQVVNNSTITVLPFEVTDETVNSSGFYAEAYPYTEPASFTNNGTLTIQEGGYASVVVDTITNTGTIDNSGDFYLGAVGETVNRGTINNQGYFSIPIFRQLDEETQEQIILPCGPVTNAAGAAINNSGDFFVSWSTESFTNAGTIISNGASFQFNCPVTNTGSITIQDGCYSSVESVSAEMASDGSDHIAGLTNSGTLAISGSSALDIMGEGAVLVNEDSGQIICDMGSINIFHGAEMENYGSVSMTGTDQAYAHVMLGGDYYFGDEVIPATPGTLVNYGAITSDSASEGAAVNIYNEGSVLTNNGAITSGIYIHENGALVNNAEITLEGEGKGLHVDSAAGLIISGDGAITIGEGGFLGAYEAGTTVTNNGTITILPGGGWEIAGDAAITGSEVVDQNQAAEAEA